MTITAIHAVHRDKATIRISMKKQIIDLANVDLLIFDLDGTIMSSLAPTYEAIKKAFRKLGLPVQVSEKEIEKYFGASSDEFYQAITPIAV